MQLPTRALIPSLLEDYRKINTEKASGSNNSNSNNNGDFFSAGDIEACLRKVVPVTVRELVRVRTGLAVRAWPAGHVLGAAMFEVRAGGQCVLYTGDYNTVADRHLGAACAPRALRPDLLVTECTYCTLVRGSKRGRERAFLTRVHQCVARGGKVLVPVFALGRAQEVMLLLDLYWERMALRVPVYYSRGLVSRANAHYTHHVGAMNETLRATFARRPVFAFRHLQPFDRAAARLPGPAVLFATPGMLHSGLSLEVFRLWCADPANLVIMPGYCAPGTVGHRVLSGARRVPLDTGDVLDVRCDVTSLSFSAHVDAKGIAGLAAAVQPRAVMLVHGEKHTMRFMLRHLPAELAVPCIAPANNTTNIVPVRPPVPATLSPALLRRRSSFSSSSSAPVPIKREPSSDSDTVPPSKRPRTSSTFEEDSESESEDEVNVDVGGAVVLVEGGAHSRHVRVVTRAEAAQELGVVRQRVRSGRRVPANPQHSLSNEQFATALDDIAAKLTSFVFQHPVFPLFVLGCFMHEIHTERLQARTLCAVQRERW